LSGPIGNIIGSVITGEDSNSESSQETGPSPEETEPEQVSPEDTPAATNAEPQPATPEEQIGNALKDLFGRKKKG